MQKLLRLLALSVILLIIPMVASADSDGVSFRRIRINDGLSSYQVNDILRGSHGYIWIATQNGLSRFDGFSFKVFLNDRNDPKSLPNDDVLSIQEDKNSRLWIETLAGYCSYDPLTETFDTLSNGYFDKYGVVGTPDQLYVDEGRNLWLSVPGKGVYKIDAKTTLTRFLAFGKELHDAAVVGMKSKGDRLVISYSDGYLTVVSVSTGKVVMQTDFVKVHATTRSNSFESYIDKDYNLWVTTDNGVFIYNRTRKKWFLSVRQWLTEGGYDNALNVMQIKDIVNDHIGQWWLATDHQGLIRINPWNRTVNQYLYERNNINSLPDNTLQCLYVDDTGALWVGTYKNGLAYHSHAWERFTTVPLGDICTIAQDRSGVLWCGSNDSGITTYNPTTGAVTAIGRDKSGLGSNTVVSSLAAKDGSLWFGTYNGGLARYKDGVWKVFRAGDGSGLRTDNVWALCEMPDGRIAVGTLGSGVQILHPSTSTFGKTYDQAGSGLASNYVNSIVVSKNGYLIVATSEYFSLIDMKTGKVTNVTKSKEGVPLLSRQINQIFEDSRGILWMATSSGVQAYDPATDQLSTVSSLAGMEHYVTCSVVEDKQHNIWVVNDHSVARVQLKRGDDGAWTSFSTVFDDLDGLQDRQFNYRSILLAGNGNVIIGGQDGINIVAPKDAKTGNNKAKVIFSGLVLFDHPLKVGEKYDGDVVMDKDMDLTHKLKLKHNYNTFTIQLASNEVMIPQRARFQYRMRGLSDKWLTTASGQNGVTFNGLRPGHYTLEAKVVDRDGTVGTATSSLSITILPPFYLSVWAIILYIIIIALVVWYVRRTMLRRQKARMEVERYQLEAQRTKEMNDMKLTFFTNLSHELRTPLMLIITPLQAMLNKEKDADKHHKLELIYRNAQNLMALVSQILDFRKIETNSEKFNPVSGDIVGFVHKIVSGFESLGGKKIDVRFESQTERLVMMFDPDKVRKIMNNLMSNAMKYTPDKGSVTVSLSIRGNDDTADNMLDIAVADTGVGISDDDKEHIFERFFMAKNSEGNPYGGSGVGLSLVRDFALMHGGNVAVADNKGGGTVFTVSLPIRHEQAEVPATNDSVADEPVVSDNQTNQSNQSNQPNQPNQTNQSNQPNQPNQSNQANPPENFKPTILLVDDSKDFIEFMSDELSERYNIRTAYNGREALDSISELRPDLILSDVMMPEMDGNELCRAVKGNKATAGIPFIMLTARLATEHQMEGLDNGANDYITKPFNLDMLYMRIDNLLKLRYMPSDDKHGKVRPELKHVEVTSLDKQLVEKATSYIDENIGDSSINVEAMAKELGISRVQLYKKLLSITGNTPTEFIRQIRLRRAEQLLRESQLTVSEIAYKVGFNNPRYFSKYFKEMFGVMPSKYKK